MVRKARPARAARTQDVHAAVDRAERGTFDLLCVEATALAAASAAAAAAAHWKRSSSCHYADNILHTIESAVVAVVVVLQEQALPLLWRYDDWQQQEEW